MTLKPTSNTGGGGGSGTVTQVSSANTSIGVATGTTTPVLTVGTADLLFTNNPPAAAVALNSQKITGLANGTLSTDAAAFGQIPAAPATDGWTSTADTWTYASGSGGGTATFTIAGVDRTAQLTPGTRIKLTQTTVKYFVVALSAFSTNTTVTITAGSDYTLANAAITAPFYSYQANPQGYPGWFNWAWTPTGFSAAGTYTTQFCVNGRMVTMSIVVGSLGTSNATTFTFAAPIAASAGSGAAQLANVIDNGANLGSPGVLNVGASGTTVTLNKTTAGAAFTNSGTKGVQGVFSYQI